MSDEKVKIEVQVIDAEKAYGKLSELIAQAHDVVPVGDDLMMGFYLDVIWAGYLEERRIKKMKRNDVLVFMIMSFLLGIGVAQSIDKFSKWMAGLIFVFYILVVIQWYKFETLKKILDKELQEIMKKEKI